MKRIIIPIIWGLLFITSCSVIQPANIQDADLDTLLKNYKFPAPSANNFEPERDGRGFPLELLNELKKSVHTGESNSFIQAMNDESLMITTNDFIFVPNESDEIDIGEKNLNDYFANHNSTFHFYQCDITGDENEEIIMIENNEYEYSRSNKAYLLKKSGDYYVYAGHDYIGYYRCFSIFKYEDKTYLIANFDDYKTGLTKGVGLFELSSRDTSGFMWFINNNSIYIRKTNDEYKYNLLHRNERASIVGAVQSYIDSISVDLLYTDRIYGTFYGDEKENEELLISARDNDKNNELKLWNLYSIDVDNDGQDEYFDRKIMYRGGSYMTESAVRWHDLATHSTYPAPFTSWMPMQYSLSQNWFKKIDDKTIIFSLYRKKTEDIYLLDARMYDGGQTVILLNYVITLNPQAELADYWDYASDSNFIATNYNHTDADEIFSDDLNKLIDNFAVETQGSFVPVNEDENIPDDLMVMMEEALFNGNIDSLDLGTASFEINIDDFYDKFGQQQKTLKNGDFTLYDSKSEFNRYVRHIYKYELNNDSYYLLLVDSGGSARFVNIRLYKEVGGELIPTDYLDSLDFNARIIRHNNVLYLINKSYNYNSKFTDKVSIFKLLPDQIGGYVTIELSPEKYEWKNIYSYGQQHERAITNYVDSIKDDLMIKSPISDDIEVYKGDENENFDYDRLLRLKSVSGSNFTSDELFYEIDFNNDGIPEYIDKRFWFPSNYTTLHIVNNTYKFTDTRIISINGGFTEEGINLVQLWFKEIEGKTYTFRLFLTHGYNYFLNVSLIENTDVTQVQSYIIAPESKFVIESGIMPPD